jgi:hypothetical protein
MELFLFDLIRPYTVDALGSAACAATLLTFAQKRMWPMRISAIAANLFFIGYGALGLLYPVLLLHLILLPLNVARLIELTQQDRARRIPDEESPKLILVSPALKKSNTPPLFGGGQNQVIAGSVGTRSGVRDFFRPAPP